MKKISILAMAALFLAACNQDGQTIIEDEGGNALLFNASTNVTTTRATYGAINTNALMASADGFGVFAYHNGETASPAVETESKAANFMFNQQVRYTGSWTYSPVKYWPNETGTNAESTDAESLSFLAYAPWISANDAANNKTAKSGGIVGITENTTAFDKIAIDYQVAQDPQKQVDLLWGVGDGTEYSDVEGNTNTLTDGLPLYNLFKPSTSYKVPFLFKHALSKLNLNIDAYVDAVNSNTNPVANGTKIFVRQVTFDGNLATEGTLLLKNTEAGEPLWKAIGGTDALAAAPLVLNDGREKDKEATTEKADETFACLNPMIIQKGKAFGADATEVGVTNATVSLLTPAEDGTASLMVIPVKVADPAATSTMKVTIVYDVLTFDENLGVDLKDDSQQKGSTVTNVITKTIDGFAFEAGKEYTINMHLGMNSVKFDASVKEWESTTATPIDLPSNDVASNSTTPTETTPNTWYVTDRASWLQAIAAGPLAAYYDNNPGEAVAQTGDPDLSSASTYYEDQNGVKHTWYAEVKAPKNGHDNDLPWIIVELPENFVGTIVFKYEGDDTEYTPWGTDKTFSNIYGLCAVSDNAFAGFTPFSNYTEYLADYENGNVTLSGTDFDWSKLQVKLRPKE